MTRVSKSSKAVNSYPDLRGHGLHGSSYKWVLRVTPTYNNHLNVKIMLKPMGVFSVFSRSRYTEEVTVEHNLERFLPVMESTLDRLLGVEHVKRVIGDKEL